MTSRSDIDAQVAENVMGWRVGKSVWHKRAYNGIHVSQYQGEWHPTADIKQAWMVVQKMNQRGFVVAVRVFESETIGTLVSKDNQFHAKVSGAASDATAAQAICRAALKACADNHEND